MKAAELAAELFRASRATRRNPWFEAELLPDLRKAVSLAMSS